MHRLGEAPEHCIFRRVSGNMAFNTCCLLMTVITCVAAAVDTELHTSRVLAEASGEEYSSNVIVEFFLLVVRLGADLCHWALRLVGSPDLHRFGRVH